MGGGGGGLEVQDHMGQHTCIPATRGTSDPWWPYSRNQVLQVLVKAQTPVARVTCVPISHATWVPCHRPIWVIQQ